MKKSKKNNKWPFVFIAILVAVIIVFLLVKVFYVPTKTYHSNILDVTVKVPNSFSIEERLPEVLFKKNNSEIILHGFGTNRSYKDIDEFIDDIYKLDPQIKVLDRQNLQISDLACVLILSQDTKDVVVTEKSYYCYQNSNSFFSIYTKSPELYPDLDQIAKSFRYEP